MFKVVDLSGYSFSGKSAVFDLLSEFDGYQSHSREFEFELLRTAGGISDLESSLVHNWSPVRSAEAIRRFKRVINSYAGTNSFWSRLTTIGFQYDSYFPSFTKESDLYINKLIVVSWFSEWPFALSDLSKSSIFVRKIKRYIGVKAAFEFEVYLSRLSEKEFIEITREYMHNLFSSCLGPDDNALIVNNAFESFFPLNFHKYFSNPKSIIVDRDPRDIYMAASQQGIISNSNVGKAAIGSSVEDFVKRFLVYRCNNDNDSENILKVMFEKLVVEYESSLSEILAFLNENESIHVNQKKYFDPSISVKGVGAWKKASRKIKKDIDYIHSELNDYCIDT